MAIYAFGFCGFILPERVVIGGAAGLSTIVYFLEQRKSTMRPNTTLSICKVTKYDEDMMNRSV